MKYLNSLHPPQQSAFCLLKADLEQKNYAILKAGMRSGKNLIAAAIVEQVPHVHLVVLSQYKDMAHHVLPRDLMFSRNQLPALFSLPKREHLTNPDETLVIVDNVFWTPGSRKVFDLMLELGYKVFAFGSNGPEYVKGNWAALGGHGYATWELNLDLSRDQAVAIAGRDSAKFERDFGKF